MKSMNDAEALRCCRSGDIRGLEALVMRYQLAAIRIAYLLAHDRSLAEDIVQDSFLVAYHKCKQFREGAPFVPWFHRIVLNTARQRLRTTTRRKESSLDALRDVDAPLPDASQTSDPADHAERAERNAAVVDILQTLTLKQREVLALRFYCGYTEIEIAHMVGRPAGTVRWRLHVALRAFEHAAQRIRPWLLERNNDMPLMLAHAEGGTQV